MYREKSQALLLAWNSQITAIECSNKIVFLAIPWTALESSSDFRYESHPLPPVFISVRATLTIR